MVITNKSEFNLLISFCYIINGFHKYFGGKVKLVKFLWFLSLTDIKRPKNFNCLWLLIIVSIFQYQYNKNQKLWEYLILNRTWKFVYNFNSNKHIVTVFSTLLLVKCNITRIWGSEHNMPPNSAELHTPYIRKYLTLHTMSLLNLVNFQLF